MRSEARFQNNGLRKVCRCSRRAWAKCEHSWYLNFRYRKGKHHRISLDKHAGKHLSKEQAKTLANDLRAAIQNGEYPPLTPSSVPLTTADVTFAELGEKWIARERQDRVDDWKSDRSRLARLAMLVLDDVPLGQRPIGRITADDLEEVFRQLESKLSGSTLNKYLQACMHLQRWAVRKGYLARPWFDPDNRPIHRQKGRRRVRRLEADVLDPHGKLLRPGEERRLLSAANPWMQRLIIAALETGCRRGELLKLQWRHVDMARGRIHLPADITKTDEGRTIVISGRLRAVLEMVRTNVVTGKDHDATAFVFGNGAGEPVGSPKKAWETIVLRAHGVKPAWIACRTGKGRRLSPECRQQLAAIDLHWHDLRHEAGSRWIEAGWPIHHVQQMLGHADLKQTSTYLNATLSGIEDSMRRLDEARALQSVAHEAETEHRPVCNDDQQTEANTTIN